MKIIILSFVVTFMVIMLFKSTIDLIDRVKEKSFLYSLIEQCTDCSHDEIITFKKQLSREEQITFLKSLKYKESLIRMDFLLQKRQILRYINQY